MRQRNNRNEPGYAFKMFHQAWHIKKGTVVLIGISHGEIGGCRAEARDDLPSLENKGMWRVKCIWRSVQFESQVPNE